MNKPMRQRAYVSILGIIMCLLWSTLVRAGFLDSVCGARPAGMGEAFTSIADDANALLFNPAGLARLEYLEVTTMYSDLYSGMQAQLYTGQNDRLGYNFAAAVVPLDAMEGSLGLAWTQFHSIFYQENVFLLSASRHLWPDYAIDIGLNLKGLQWKLEANDYTVNYPGLQKYGLSADIGFLASPWPEVNVGFCLDNIIPVNMGLTRAEFVPVILRVGASYRLALDMPSLQEIQTALEINLRDGFYLPKLGVETHWFQNWIALRAGINPDQAAGGLGICYDWPQNPLALQVDYAFTYPFQLTDTLGSHRISVSIIWDEKIFGQANLPVKSIQSSQILTTSNADHVANTNSAFYQNEVEYNEYRHFKEYWEYKKQEAQQAAEAAQAAQKFAEQEAVKAAQAAEIAKAANFSINLREEIVVGFEKKLLKDFAQIQDSLPWAEAVFAYLMKWTGLKLTPKEYNGWEDLQADFQAGEVDLILCGPEGFKKLEAQRLVQPLATYVIGGKNTQRYCLLVRDDNQILQLRDVKEKRLGCFQHDYLQQLSSLFFKHIPEYPAEIHFSASQLLTHPVDGLVALQMKEVDVVLGLEYVVYVYERIKDQMTGNLKVLAWSEADAVPNAPLCARTLMNPAKMKKVELLLETLAKMHQNQEGQHLLAAFKIDRFKLWSNGK